MVQLKNRPPESQRQLRRMMLFLAILGSSLLIITWYRQQQRQDVDLALQPASTAHAQQPERTVPLSDQTFGVLSDERVSAKKIADKTKNNDDAKGESPTASLPPNLSNIAIMTTTLNAERQFSPPATLGPVIMIPADLRKDGNSDTDLFYNVSPGDTLWEIAERLTGDPWNYKEIVRQNGIANPDLIFPKQKLQLESYNP